MTTSAESNADDIYTIVLHNKTQHSAVTRVLSKPLHETTTTLSLFIHLCILILEKQDSSSGNGSGVLRSSIEKMSVACTYAKAISNRLGVR